MQLLDLGLPIWLQVLMQLFVAGTMVYLLQKYRHDLLAVCLIFLCYPSIFIFLGKNIENTYKVSMLLFVCLVFLQRRAWRRYRLRDAWFIAAFVLFSIQFFMAVFLYSNNTFTIIFSQYARYVETLLLFFLLRDVFVRGQQDNILRLFYDIFLMQILISCFKWLIFRRQIEGLVGSFSIIGGAMGTTIPLIGFILLWVYRRGKFSWKDWLYVLGLLIIGFTTGKRAIIFILPLVVAAFMIYVNGVKLNRYILLALIAAPFVFYLGVRLTPSLNPENKIWGSFDYDYAFNYAETYQFGKEGVEGSMEQLQELQQVSYVGGNYVVDDRIKTEGRGGATIGIIQLLFSGRKLTDADLYGIGFKNMYGIDYGTFQKLPLSIEISHKGAATGVYQSYVTTGLLGAFCTILLCFIPFLYCKHRRMRLVLLAVVAWEYFFYTGMIFRVAVFMAVLIFAIFYVNSLIANSKKEN